MVAWGGYPMEILASENRLTFIYEVESEVRRIFLDGKSPPEFYPTSAMGWSNGHWDGSDLVIDTQLIEGNVRDFRGEPVSDGARMRERYSLSEDGTTLSAVIHLIDPDNYRHPPIRRRQWVRKPDVEIYPWECDPDFFLQTDVQRRQTGYVFRALETENHGMNRALRILLTAFFLSACQPNAEAPLPEQAATAAVAIPDSYGADVAEDILRAGGNAVDAAIAVGFSMAVTFIDAGNIGGGGFMPHPHRRRNVVSLDYREKAPLAAHRDMYLDEHGEVIEKRKPDRWPGCRRTGHGRRILGSAPALRQVAVEKVSHARGTPCRGWLSPRENPCRRCSQHGHMVRRADQLPRLLCAHQHG